MCLYVKVETEKKTKNNLGNQNIFKGYLTVNIQDQYFKEEKRSGIHDCEALTDNFTLKLSDLCS